MTTIERAYSGIMIFLLPAFCASTIYGFMHLNSLAPGFAETLATFGENLSLLTLLFTNYHTVLFYSLSAISAVALGAAYYPKKNTKFQSVAFYYSLASPIVFGLFLMLFLLAVYLPILGME